MVVGAIGKVWKLAIPFRHVDGAAAYAALCEPGWIKVAWALRVVARGALEARVELEVRVDATDDESWRRFRRYFRVIGPGSHVIRRSLLATLARQLGGAVGPGGHARDGWREVMAGIGGAGRMVFAMLTPFARHARSRWGLSAAEAARGYPGDALVEAPRWGWTHGIEIDAPARAVWPWIAQIGADRAGFYSYQWLENLVGCDVHNAETIRADWQVREGDELRLHPKVPALRVQQVEPGRWFVALQAADRAARAAGRPWVAGSWLFLVAPLGDQRCRFVSRYRAASSDDLATRLRFGPTLVEPIGFAMDRRMLLGVKERAERAHRQGASGTTGKIGAGASANENGGYSSTNEA